jgi:hypothetical protein
MKDMKNIFWGLGNIFSLLPSARNYQIAKNGPQVDAKRLSGDFSAVGADMRRALKNDKQAHKRQR